MRHIYNCEQISIPRAVSYHEMHEYPSQHIVMSSDTQNSSFDESIPTPTIKGQFDFTSKARLMSEIGILIPFSLFLPRQRLELMREMYTNAADTSPTSPDRNTESISTADTSSGSIQADPFYDRFPWFRPIGR